MTLEIYNTMLRAGLGLVSETHTLLDLWEPGMSSVDLKTKAVESGQFPNVAARRIRDWVTMSFSPRYLAREEAPARLLKSLKPILNNGEFNQLLFLYTCRAHPILADFVREIYWPNYSAGRDSTNNEEAREFIKRANHNGKTIEPWSEETIQRVASDLTGCCADFGLLESGSKVVRKILPYRIHPRVTAVLAYDLHFNGIGDNLVLSHPDWALFGIDRADVLNELKRLALKGLFIVQAAGEIVRIGWQYKTMEELTNVLAQGELR